MTPHSIIVICVALLLQHTAGQLDLTLERGGGPQCRAASRPPSPEPAAAWNKRWFWSLSTWPDTTSFRILVVTEQGWPALPPSASWAECAANAGHRPCIPRSPQSIPTRVPSRFAQQAVPVTVLDLLPEVRTCLARLGGSPALYLRPAFPA